MQGPFATPFNDICGGRVCTTLDQHAHDLGTETIQTEAHELELDGMRAIYLSVWFDDGWYVSPPIEFTPIAHLQRHGDAVTVTTFDGVTVSARPYPRQPWPVVKLEVSLSVDGLPGTSSWIACGRSTNGIPRCSGLPSIDDVPLRF